MKSSITQVRISKPALPCLIHNRVKLKQLGGGRNTTVKRGWNYATDAKRSPGSTIKPILDYGPAVEYLNWSTYHPNQR